MWTKINLLKYIWCNMFYYEASYSVCYCQHKLVVCEFVIFSSYSLLSNMYNAKPDKPLFYWHKLSYKHISHSHRVMQKKKEKRKKLWNSNPFNIIHGQKRHFAFHNLFGFINYLILTPSLALISLGSRFTKSISFWSSDILKI